MFRDEGNQLNDPGGALGRSESPPGILVNEKVDLHEVPVLPPPKLLEEKRLSDLARTIDHEGLLMVVGLPVEQGIIERPLEHESTPSIRICL